MSLGVQLDTLRTQPHWATQQKTRFLDKMALKCATPQTPKYNKKGISAKPANAIPSKTLTVMTRDFLIF